MADTGNTPAAGGGLARSFPWAAQLSRTLRRGEIALAAGLICILTVLILPMPAWLLDVSLAFSITIA